MADRFSIDNIKDLFREDVLRFTAGMRSRLEQLLSDPRDAAALEGLRGLGHSLKGTAALVGLTYLSQAGAVMERAGEVAGTHLHSDVTEALAIYRQMHASLEFVERLLTDCLASNNPETQENLYTALFMTFAPSVRAYLHDLTTVATAPSAAPQTSAVSGEDAEWARELAQIFSLELQEHLAGVPELLQQLGAAATQQHACLQLSRVFHTIKGSAAMVEQDDISALAKRLQEQFGAAAEQSPMQTLTPDFVTPVQAALDALFAAAGAVAPRLSLPEVPATDISVQIERELLDAFTIDATETIEAAEQLLLGLERQPDDRELLQALFRRFHTLKGAAAAVGLETVVEQLHQGESLLETVLDAGITVNAAKLVDFLFRLTDSVTGLINRARGVRDEQRTILTDVAVEIAALVSAPATASSPAGDVATASESADTVPESMRPRPIEHETGVVRVQAARLDALMNQVGQLVLSRTRMDQKIQAFAELRDKLYYSRTRLAEIIEGFQQRYEFNTGDRPVPIARTVPSERTDSAAAPTDDFFTDLEFDKYDDFNILARSVIELATDTGEIADQLGDFIDAFGEEARQFSKITSGLQRQITRLRLVPLDTLFRRLLRPVRDAARQENKLVDLQFSGSDVQLDKSIVEALYAPLLHMVRNGVKHGVELPAVRQTLGKPTVGTIRIVASQRHNSVLLSVQDDGHGLDFAAILDKARTMQLVDPSSDPPREQLLPFIFRPGFTTETTLTDLSGRGVGMDVVARDIAALNGSLLVESKDGQGTTIRIALPTTTSIDEVLLLQAGEQVFVLPVDFVEQAITIEMSDLIDVGGQRMLKVRNQLLPVLHLGPLVGEPVPAAAVAAIVLRAGDRAMALIVDRVHAQQEVVIRPLGPVLEAHPFLSGATISGAGAVVFVLHVGRLFDVLAQAADRQATFILRESTDAPAADARAVLVVDDSISVRKLAARFLESDGFEVDTAVDGLDALEKLASGRFRLVVTDLEMPRMHGYDLIAEMRRHPQHATLPVIVCSSRSSEKHRRRAREVGAQGYLTKPFTKEQLVAEIQRFSGSEGGRVPGAADVGAPG